MDRLRCAHCGDIIGVYEPMRLLAPDGTDRRGSRLTLGDQLDVPGSTALHEHCHELFEQGRTEGRGGAGW